MTVGQSRKKVLLVLGTRPEAIKMAPVYSALSKNIDLFELRLLVTAQHREMLDQVLHWFAMTPDYDLNVMRQGQTLTHLSSKLLPPIEDIFQHERPDLVLVHGDTTTTFLASLAAFYCRIPIGHVEAGLRTGIKYAPFPEEMNRRLSDVLADWYFAPTEESKVNLLKEGVPSERTFVTGNTVIDALLQTIAKPDITLPDFVNNISEDRRIVLVTTHRRENWGTPLCEVYQALRTIVENSSDVEIIFPVHRNPLIRSAVGSILDGVDRIHLCDPLDYAAFAKIMSHAFLILTDSGGIQEEAPALGVPVLVLRESTERPEAVRAGTVKIVGTNRDLIVQSVMELLHHETAYQTMARAINPYGDGRASQRIVEFLKWKYGFVEEQPEPFGSSREEMGIKA